MSAAIRGRAKGRWVPFALIALGAIPVVAGTLRLSELAGAPPVLPFNPRITASPLTAVIHVTSAIPYLILGAFEFSSALRLRWSGRHLRAGQALLVLGLAVALSALWMTLDTHGRRARASCTTSFGSRSGRRWLRASSSAW